MIVIGADTHKRNHMLVAVDGQTGALCGQREIPASDAGSLDALRFAGRPGRGAGVGDRGLPACLGAPGGGADRCGERVIRVPAVMTSQTRKVARQAGKSDPIDARAVALAVIRDGIESFPVAFTDHTRWRSACCRDYRDQIISERTRMINRLRWHLVTIAPELEAQLNSASLRGPRICARLARQPDELPHGRRCASAAHG